MWTQIGDFNYIIFEKKLFFRDCPVCREADIDVRNLFAEKAIVHLPIPCINKQFGCKEEVPYSDKETHENNCTFRPFNCPFIECDEKLVAADVVDHVTLKHAEDFKNRLEKQFISYIFNSCLNYC